MLLKWLFTLLAIVWLYQALQPFFAAKQIPKQSPPGSKRDDDNGDYVDYEEIK